MTSCVATFEEFCEGLEGRKLYHVFGSKFWNPSELYFHDESCIMDISSKREDEDMECGIARVSINFMEEIQLIIVSPDDLSGEHQHLTYQQVLDLLDQVCKTMIQVQPDCDSHDVDVAPDYSVINFVLDDVDDGPVRNDFCFTPERIEELWSCVKGRKGITLRSLTP